MPTAKQSQAVPTSSQSGLEQFLASRPVVLQLLRFIAIGAINTTLDFIIFNAVSKFLGIQSGFQLGLINIVGFAAAMTQSYFWNKYWAFGAGKDGMPKLSAITEFLRLVLVGGLGGSAFVVVLMGARYEMDAMFYIVTLALFLGIELILWLMFGLKNQADEHSTHFLVFTIVSIIGLLINIGIVAIVSSYLVSGSWPGLNVDLLKNAAKILATIVSLIWNFIGYKLIVFRK